MIALTARAINLKGKAANQSYKVHIAPLVVNSLRDMHKHTDVLHERNQAFCVPS